MNVTQPPVDTILLHHLAGTRVGSLPGATHPVSLYASSGVTLGMVIDAYGKMASTALSGGDRQQLRLLGTFMMRD